MYTNAQIESLFDNLSIVDPTSDEDDYEDVRQELIDSIVVIDNLAARFSKQDQIRACLRDIMELTERG